MSSLSFKWHSSLNEINEKQWNNITSNQLPPFFQWNWLNNLERSKSISRMTGWHPIHLSVWRKSTLIGFAPLYLKIHSYGEFIFDHIFVRLANDLGLNYYPKIVGMSPFSPITGYRFLISPEEEQKEIMFAMLEKIDEFAIQNKILSCNFLHVDQGWSDQLEQYSFTKWINKKSLWERNQTKNFSDYLNNFNANQRRNIKRERKAVKDAGITINAHTGTDIDSGLVNLMHYFYEKHCSNWGIWGSKYLSADFFSNLASNKHQNDILLFTAHQNNKYTPVAMSLCVKNKKSLWGRYWGSKLEIDFLHFEVCYYSPISWALENGIQFFDPGAGGEHKNRRGFLTQPNFSMHKWYDQNMTSLIKPWITKVNKMMQIEIQASNNDLPYKSKT